MSAPRRPPRRKVDGVLLLDKPQGITSNTALQIARRLSESLPPAFRGMQLIEGAGHWVQFEAPEAFDAALERALSSA